MIQGASLTAIQNNPSVSDGYDALRSERPYTPAFTHEKSCGIIIKSAGWHFDTAVIIVSTDLEAAFAEIRTRMDS